MMNKYYTLRKDNLYLHQDVQKCNTPNISDSIKFDSYGDALDYRNSVLEFIPDIDVLKIELKI